MRITGETIRKYRKDRKLTQDDLADELGVRGNTVWRWEAGYGISRLAMKALKALIGKKEVKHG
jgi:transcriptional regulator with XRE-family HTH domain